MMHRSAFVVVTLALFGVGSAATWAQGNAALPRDRQVVVERNLGHLSPVDNIRCVQRRRIAETLVISDQRILYRASRGLVWDAELNPGCEGLANSPYAPRNNSRGSQLCAGDAIEVVSPGRTNSCTINGFRVWSQPER